MTWIFYVRQFVATLSTNYIFLRQKSLIDFSPHFGHFFTASPTSESFNNPVKVIPFKGIVVEYLPFWFKGAAPQTIVGKKYFQAGKYVSYIKLPAPYDPIAYLFAS